MTQSSANPTSEVRIDKKLVQKVLKELQQEFSKSPEDIKKKMSKEVYALIDSINPSDLKENQGDYKKIQSYRAKLIQKPAKIIDKTGDDVAARKAIAGDIDYKIVRLKALLANSSISQNEKFRATMQWLEVNESEREKFKARYQLLTGQALETDLEENFPENGNIDLGIISQSEFLKDVLSQGESTPEAQLALELGLVDGSYTIERFKEKISGLDKQNKEAIRKSIRENPTIFKHLAYSGDQDESQYVTALRNFLKNGHSGILGEQQEYLRDRLSLTREEKNDPRIPKDPKERYLLSLVYDFKTHRPRQIDKIFLRKAIKDFASDRNNAEAIKSLIKAYDRLIDYKGLRSDKNRKNPFNDVNPYNQFWKWMTDRGIDNSLYHTPIKYIRNVLAHRQGIENLEPVYDTYALLERRGEALVKTKRENTKKQVLQNLSSTNNWQALEELKAYTGENNSQLKVSELSDKALEYLKEKLKKADLNEADRAEIIRQVELGGAFDADGYAPRSMKVYQNLSNLLEKGESISDKKIFSIIGEVKPGSFDYQLIASDGKLLNYIHKKLRKNQGDSQKTVDTWNIFTKSFNLGNEWQYYRDHTDKEKRMKPKPYNPLKSYELDSQKRANYWAGRLAAQYKIQDDGNRALEVVYQAQAAGVTGAELKQVLDGIDPKISNWMVNDRKKFVNPGNKEAHTTIKEYFQKPDKVITVKELLRSQKALISYDQKGVNFTVGSLSPGEVLQGWFKKGLTELQRLSAEKIKIEMNLLSATLEKKQAEIKKLQKQLTDKRKQIQNYSLNIDRELGEELDKLVGIDQKDRLKQELIAKAGQAFIDGSHEAVGNLKLNSAELQTIGVTLKGQSDIQAQRQLQTSSVGWHQFNTAGVVTSGQIANTLGAFSNIHQAFSEDRNLDNIDKQMSLVKATIEEEEKLKTSQENWRDVQDRYRENTVKAVTTLVSLMVNTAGLAAGVGAATAMTQLTWALSSAAGQSAIKQAVNRALSRKGELSSATTIAEVIADTLESAVTFFVVNESEVGLRLVASPVLDGSEKVVTRGVVELPIAKMKKTLGDLKDGVVNAMKQDEFAKHPLDTLTSNFGQMLKAKIANIPKETIQKYLTTTTAESSNLIFNAITAGNYHDTTDIIKLYRDEETGGLSESKKDEALSNLFNYSEKETDKLNHAAQFVGGPTAQMGSDTWIGVKRIWKLWQKFR